MEEIAEKERPGAVWLVLYVLGVGYPIVAFTTWFADGGYAFASTCALFIAAAWFYDHVYGWFTR